MGDGGGRLGTWAEHSPNALGNCNIRRLADLTAGAAFSITVCSNVSGNRFCYIIVSPTQVKFMRAINRRRSPTVLLFEEFG